MPHLSTARTDRSVRDGYYGKGLPVSRPHKTHEPRTAVGISGGHGASGVYGDEHRGQGRRTIYREREWPGLREAFRKYSASQEVLLMPITTAEDLKTMLVEGYDQSYHDGLWMQQARAFGSSNTAEGVGRLSGVGGRFPDYAPIK